MSQDITLSVPRTLPAAPDDLWYQGTALGMPQAQQPQPLKKIHRLLRGRYLLAIVLATIGGILGAVIGFNSQIPMYLSEGLIQVDPSVQTGVTAEKGLPYYSQFVRSQAFLFRSPRVLDEAVKHEDWKRFGGRTDADAVASFGSRLSAENIRDTSLIRVTFQHPDPQRAKAGVDAAIDAYMQLQHELNSENIGERLKGAQQRRDEKSREYFQAQQYIRSLADQYNTDELGPIHTSMLQRVSELQQQLTRITFVREQMQAVTPKEGEAGVDVEQVLAVSDLARVDPQVGELYRQQVSQVGRLNEMLMRLGRAHFEVKLQEERLGQTTIALEAAVHEARQRIFDIQPSLSGGGSIVIDQQTIRQAELQERQIRYELTTLQGEANAMGKIRQEIARLKDQMAQAKETIDQHDRSIESLTWQMAVRGNIKVRGKGTTPIAPHVDKRSRFALAGFVGGAGLPIALLLLIGLLDSRYRYSDDAGGTNMSGLTLLGILPNLPDRLSDPGQASIAAHCVHQIRTMLQINSTEDRRAFTVTSSSSGDGKTSLTLALGLSFAASGSRTLLIDADLVGAGLTARLNMTGPEGILEAINNRDLLSYTRTTDIADLSILPVGMAQLHHAGIFSPAAVKRLLNEAKKHFEIILIDTGPILGSIEATPVAASCDGVILTVARGQQRPMVEKALDHLRSIGARIAGVVFNRAQARDFEQSISGISLRSASRSSAPRNGNGKSHHSRETPGQYGPVARAVASSVKVHDDNEKN